MRFMGKILKWTAICCFLLAGAVFVFGQARVSSALCVARDHVNAQLDDLVGQEAQIREEIRRLQTEYPKQIAELQFSLHQIDEDIAELVNDSQLCTKVVALCDQDLANFQVQPAVWHGPDVGECDVSGYEQRIAERRLSEIQLVRGRYDDRKGKNDQEIVSLQEERERVASALASVRGEQQEFEAELSRLYRELDSLERSRTLIKLAERRDPINVSRYSDSVASLRQLRGKIEQKRLEQEERRRVLRLHRRNAEYEARATIEMQTGKEGASLALTATD
jgi:chromosome segregation ATPase